MNTPVTRPALQGNETKRLTYIDVAKGIGILMVILGHSLAYTGYTGSRLFATIYAFHMAFFFFLSGYVYSHKSSDAFFSGKVKALLIPMLLYQSLNMLLYFGLWCVGKVAWHTKLKFGGFWFILTLLLITVIHYTIDTLLRKRLVEKVHLKNVLHALIAILFLAAGLAYAKSISDQPNQPIATAFVGYFYYVIGTLYRFGLQRCECAALQGRHAAAIRLCAFVLGLLCLAALYLTAKRNSVSVDMNTSRYGVWWIYILQAFLGLFGMYAVSFGILRNPFLQFFGRNSLIILITHIPVSKVTAAIGKHLQLSKPVILIISTVSATIFSIFIVWLFTKYLPILAGKINWESNHDRQKTVE